MTKPAHSELMHPLDHAQWHLDQIDGSMIKQMTQYHVDQANMWIDVYKQEKALRAKQ